MTASPEGKITELNFSKKLMQRKFKSKLSVSSRYYAEMCNEFAGFISASLHPGNTAPFEKMLQRWRAVDNTVSDLTGLIFEPQTSRSRDKCVTARPTGWYRAVACSCGAGGLRFKFRAGQIEYNVANDSSPLRHFFERSCVARVQ